jgi:RecJ-like exonuclease
LIVCDIALNGGALELVLDRFRLIASAGSLLYIDHHPYPESLDSSRLPGRAIHELGPCASELTYIAFKDRLPWVMSRVAIFGAIGDYADDTVLIRELLEDWDKRTVFLEAGILVQGLEGDSDLGFKREVVKLLSKGKLPSSNIELLGRALVETSREEKLLESINNEIRKTGDVAYVLDFDASLGKAANYARICGAASVGVAAKTVNNWVEISLRTREDTIDLNTIVRTLAERYGGSGGGHPRAAGAKIPATSFTQFVQALSGSTKGSVAPST